MSRTLLIGQDQLGTVRACERAQHDAVLERDRFSVYQELNFEDVQKAQAAVLTIHGMKDRSAPYGGGREWAMMLPNARLVSVEKAGHAPWVEAPELVFWSDTGVFWWDLAGGVWRR